MSITVDPLTDGDFTRIHRLDATSGITVGGVWSMLGLDTTSQVENTGCIFCRVPAGIGSCVANFTSRSLENQHLRMWGKLSQSISAGATYGARIILGTEANHGSWIVYDEDRQVVVYNGWMMLVVDPMRPFDSIVGTPPGNIAAITDAGIRVDFVDGNGKDLVVADMLWEGNEVSIEGGSDAAPGLFSEWASDDRTNGYGILREVGGVLYLNAGAVFQGPGTASSYFRDINRLILFEDLPVAGHLYKLRHVGNSTGTNEFVLGVLTGTGVDEAGAQGGVIRSAGEAPWRIEALSGDQDKVHYLGVTMQGPSAHYQDYARNMKVDDGGTITDDTRDFNDTDAADVSTWGAPPQVNDALYFGHNERFHALRINPSTAGATYTAVWEYYNGTAWAALTDVHDSTDALKRNDSRSEYINWSMPDDWAKTTVDSDNRYWIRLRVTGAGGTSPTITQGWLYLSGDSRWEDATACKMIDCSMNGMGAIRVRNGAALKKCTIANARSSGKYGAVDLGGADPSANTVRDLTIQGCRKGMLLKGSGNVTFNLRNIKFADNDQVVSAYSDDISELPPETIVTREANTDGLTFNPFPASPASGDGFVVGTDYAFGSIEVDVDTAGAGAYTVTWQYWNGTGWTNLSGVTDNTNSFKTAGVNTVSFTIPSNWSFRAESTVVTAEDVHALVIRANHDGGGQTTAPVIDRVKIPYGDIRVDFGGSDTVTLNILEGGDTPTIDNVNGSTVTINNTVTLQVTCLDPDGNGVQGVRVRIENASTGALISNGTTNASGVYTDSTYNFAGNVNVITKVRFKPWRFDRQAGTITVNGLTAGFTLRPNTVVDLP